MTDLQPYQTSSPIYDHVLAMLRSALWGEERFPYQIPRDVELGDIIQELKNQTVQFLVVDLLIRENPGKADSYLAASAQSAIRWYSILDLQQEICQQLSDEGIACVVVKGAAAALYYPQPNGRLIGDIDLLVKPEDFEKACQIVAQGADFLCQNERHTEYRRDGITVEVHRSFSTLPDPRKKELSDRRIFGAIDAAEILSLEDYSFPGLPPVEHGLVLLEHISIHLEEGLGLRQILDWMVFADKVLDHRFWQDEFAPLLWEVGLETLAITVTRMCQMYLGLRTDITWCLGADETLCRQLMEHVLKQGNFGRKLQDGANRAVSVLGSLKDLGAFFGILQARGCDNWKALERFPILKPFAWLYQLIRYIVRGLGTKDPIGFLRDVTERAKTQDDFLEALGVRRMAEEMKK